MVGNKKEVLSKTQEIGPAACVCENEGVENGCGLTVNLLWSCGGEGLR